MSYPKPNYTQIPNLLLDDDMPEMSHAELKVTLAILRKIVGFHKDGPEPMSLSQLQKMTGLSRKSVIAGIEEALTRGRICLSEKKGPRGVSLYTVDFLGTSEENTPMTSGESILVTGRRIKESKESDALHHSPAENEGGAEQETEKQNDQTFRTIQRLVVDAWFNGDWANASWAGSIANMLLGLSDDPRFMPYNFTDKPFTPEETERLIADLRRRRIEFPTSPSKIRKAAASVRAKNGGGIVLSAPDENRVTASLPKPRYNADGTPIEKSS